jgi:transcriptional regulator with GAF, ATPase, and Fis domain
VTLREARAAGVELIGAARASGPFVALNCSVLTGDMALSELFGHERGAFTGADRRRAGRFELAKGGTLFLDEVGDLPSPAQVQLLRVLQERVFERMGGEETLEADVRLVAATHRDLRQGLAGGHFREDLFYRLNAFPMLLPPLRDRLEDVVPLAAHFVKTLAKELEMPDLHIEAAALRELTRHPWPGNVRELQNALRRAAILAGGRTITPGFLDRVPASFADAPGTPGQAPPLPEGLNRLERAQAREVLLALEESGGKVGGKQGAAALLGVPPTTLHSLMHRLGLK